MSRVAAAAVGVLTGPGETAEAAALGEPEGSDWIAAPTAVLPYPFREVSLLGRDCATSRSIGLQRTALPQRALGR